MSEFDDLGECDGCKSKRLAQVLAHSSDMSTFICQEDDVYLDNRYFPEVLNICDGDDVNMIVCLNCGKIQGKFPIPAIHS